MVCLPVTRFRKLKYSNKTQNMKQEKKLYVENLAMGEQEERFGGICSGPVSNSIDCFFSGAKARARTESTHFDSPK